MVEISQEETDRISEFVMTPEGGGLFSQLQEAKGRNDERAFNETFAAIREKARIYVDTPADGVVFVNGMIRPAKPKPKKRKVFVPDTYRFFRQPSLTASAPEPTYPERSESSPSLLPSEGFDVKAASMGVVDTTAVDFEQATRPRQSVVRRNNQGRFRPKRR